MANLRAGLIGLGMMGRHHARVLDALAGVDLVAVADAGGDSYGVAHGRPLVPTIAQLLEHRLDYCVIAVPTAEHLAAGLEVAAAGVHALIEKPLAHDSAASAQLDAAFRAQGLVAAVGHIERYNAALQQARARLAAGELGEVYQVATRRQGPVPPRVADVGVVKDLGTHDIDLTAWITGSEYARVAAQTAHRFDRQPDADGEHEDLVAITGLLRDATVTSHLVNWVSPMKERVTIITGERGTYVADTLTADLTFSASGNVQTTWDDLAQLRGVSEGDVVRFAFAKPEPLLVEHENFRDAVLGKESEIVTLAEGAATIRVAEAVLESARTGLTVPL